jgi:hypothetical protein
MRRGMILREAHAAATLMTAVALVLVSGRTSAGQERPAPPSAPSGLVVVSDPTATVILDGVPRGETPVRLTGLAPGEHRLQLNRPGYLEYNRLVTIKAGDIQELTISLPLSGTAAPATPKVESDKTAAPNAAAPKANSSKAETPKATPTSERRAAAPEKKGGSKLVWILPLTAAAAGGGGYAIYNASKKNLPPSATATAGPTGAGMMGLTRYTFSGAGSSDPEQKPLTYAWNFGDGTIASGSDVSHVYTTAGSFNYSLVVYDGKNEATTGGALRVNRNMAGTWRGSFTDQYGNHFHTILTLVQSGNAFGGAYSDEGGTGSVRGTISSSDYVCACNVSFEVRQGSYEPFNFAGTLTADVSRLQGSVNGSGINGQGWVLDRDK